jgi:predicted transcriptional regulator of viral defense system
MMSKTTNKKSTTIALEKLKKEGLFGISKAVEVGISKSTLSRLTARGKILRVGHGHYIHPESTMSPEIQDYVRACSKFGPDSVIGGLTALFHYHLIDQVPQVIWVIVPEDKQTRDKQYRLLRVKTFQKTGIVRHEHYAITNIERTLTEAFVYSNKIGIRTAMGAITKAIKEKKTNLSSIMHLAKKMKYDHILAGYWETIIGAVQD